MSNKFKKVVKSNASSGHKLIFSLIKELFPLEKIDQEFPIKVDRHNLFIDCFISKKSLAFEFNGQQHSKFIPFFHQSKADFARQKENDRLKELWCKENKVNLIKINFDEKIDKDKLFQKIMESYHNMEIDNEL